MGINGSGLPFFFFNTEKLKKSKNLRELPVRKKTEEKKKKRRK
jgi:hypothetical protein